MTSVPDQHIFEEEFEHEPVPQSRRHSLASVAAVWFGFPMILTNAVFGGIIAYNLGFWSALLAIAIGNAILLAYVGTLSYIAGSTGYNFALQAEHTFGRYGYALTSGFLATIVIGWYAFQTGLTGTTVHASYGWNETVTIVFATVLYTCVTFIGIKALSLVGMIAAPLYVVLGLVAVALTASDHSLFDIVRYQGLGASSAMSLGSAVTLVVATFADSGTMTADFTRWSKDGRSAVFATLTAFPVANMIAQLVGIAIVCAGAAVAPATSGGDFLPVLSSQGGFLSVITLVFVFVNLGSVCTHCLYNGAVGWSRIVGQKMRTMTIILGIIGGLVAVAGVWNLFLDWLNLLGILVPPIGAVIIVDQLFIRHFSDSEVISNCRSTAFAAWAAGAVAAMIVHYEAPAYSEAVAGILVGALIYYFLSKLAPRVVARES
ncbi:cytosine permease [Bradyrhizobium elkanii]|uniref:cytosine permease n=1 Tax=Bradyrhizobium TaxID=374 RepID=UPI002711F86E|nr:cytosine permease [Bradyrhizobium elkanii]WLA38867.1 cytosine permease [Bradyrhizobium elkanii]